MIFAKSQFVKLTQSISSEIVQQTYALKQMETVISQFMTTAETDPLTAIETRVKQSNKSVPKHLATWELS